MVLSSIPEVVGLRRRMSSNFNVSPLQSPSEHDGSSIYDSASDSISHSYSSDHGSSVSEEVDGDDERNGRGGGGGGGVELGEGAGEGMPVQLEGAGGSTETLTPTGAAGFKHRRTFRAQKKPSQDVSETAKSASWFSYDLSIVVALVSPIGQWLTGGDHVKNLLLVLLLIFYLHQLIEVPWTLYRMSIPPRRPPGTTSPSHSHTAHDELCALELVYLSLTVLSPFLGATLLRGVAGAVTGSAQPLSWFSTALFVLATGVRPWTHLVERLRGRSTALHAALRDEAQNAAAAANASASADIDADADADADAEVDAALEELHARIQTIEARLARLGARHKGDVGELRARLQDVLDGVEGAVRRQQRQLAAAMSAQDARLAALEACVAGGRCADARHQQQQQERQQEGQAGVVARSAAAAQRWWSWLLHLPSERIERAVGGAPPAPVLHGGKAHGSAASGRPARDASAEPRNGRRGGSQLDPIPEEITPVPSAALHASKKMHYYPTPATTTSIPKPTTTTTAYLTPHQRVTAFVLSPVRFGLRVTWSTITLPVYLFRLVAS